MSEAAARVFTALVKLIANGEWLDGEELPGMRELMVSWQISMTTAAEVTVALKADGVATAGSVRGTAVAAGGREAARRWLLENGQAPV